jgi:predicted nucleic acid binding AN1-type Zn finger protein
MPSVRCEICSKKLGIMELVCKCGKKLCVTHIQCENHNCSFDHKKDGQDRLKKQLDTVGLTEKVIKI